MPQGERAAPAVVGPGKRQDPVVRCQQACGGPAHEPAISLVVAAGALLAIAAPALGMKTQNLTLDQEFGDSLPIVATYDRVNEAFPGGSDPAEVVV